MPKTKLQKIYEQNREAINITVAIVVLLLFAFVNMAKAEGLQRVECDIKGKLIYTGTYAKKDYKYGTGYFKGTDWNYQCKDGICTKNSKPFEIIEIYDNDLHCSFE